MCTVKESFPYTSSIIKFGLYIPPYPPCIWPGTPPHLHHSRPEGTHHTCLSSVLSHEIRPRPQDPGCPQLPQDSPSSTGMWWESWLNNIVHFQSCCLYTSCEWKSSSHQKSNQGPFDWAKSALPLLSYDNQTKDLRDLIGQVQKQSSCDEDALYLQPIVRPPGNLISGIFLQCLHHQTLTVT